MSPDDEDKRMLNVMRISCAIDQYTEDLADGIFSHCVAIEGSTEHEMQQRLLRMFDVGREVISMPTADELEKLKISKEYWSEIIGPSLRLGMLSGLKAMFQKSLDMDLLEGDDDE